MAEENVELGYRAIDALNRRDLEALLELMDENVEAVSRIVAMEGGLHGHDGVRRWWKSWFDAFPDYRMEVVEMRDSGDVVVAALRAVGHGAGSDLPVDDNIFQATRWRDRKCVWWQVFRTKAEALEAVGLSE
jgi:ketosteroid isomerase-like protein